MSFTSALTAKLPMDSSAKSYSGSRLALVVRIGADLYALSIDLIEEVLPSLPIEQLPQCPSFVRGVVFVRGQLIPVLDAAERLGLRNHARSLEPNLVCLRCGTRLVGLEVDEAMDLIEVPRTALTVDQLHIQGRFLSGLVEKEGRVIRILDVVRLMTDQETVEMEHLPGMVPQ